MKVRWKLLTLLVVPLLALALLGYVGIDDRQGAVRSANREGAIAELAQRGAVATDALDREALAAAQALHTPDPKRVSSLQALQRRTDDAMTQLRRGMGNTLGGDVAVRSQTALTAVAGLRRLTGPASLAEPQSNRDDQIEKLLGAYGNAVGSVLDLSTTEVGNGDAFTANMRSYQALRRSREQSFATLAYLTLRGQGVPVGEVVVQAAVSQYVTQRSLFLGLAPLAQVRRYNQTVLPLLAENMVPLEDAAAQGKAAVLASRSLPSDTAALAALDTYRANEAGFEQALLADIGAARSAAAQDVRAFVFLMLTISAFALVSVSVLSRGISGPLNRLTRQARRVADEQLPALLETLRDPASADHLPQLERLPTSDSRDEIGDLSRAFDAIQHAAVGVAVEQSLLLRKGIGELFVNLARRNQSLLDRQIGLLDDLERTENDPDALGQLFRLDHLATRMRRNAESLLVLAGVDSPRRWAQVMPLIDVIKAATG
ncbi:MAG: putative sensor with domain, partial [Acidimicrobiia bacterium]|nr:putative sensor with domain [Acidimicrobiia bacterium]